MNHTQRTLYFAAVCAAILAVGILMFLFVAKTAHAQTVNTWVALDWDGSHFSQDPASQISTADEEQMVCVVDSPYDPLWGAYGTGFTSYSGSPPYALADVSYNWAAIYASRNARDGGTGTETYQFAITCFPDFGTGTHFYGLVDVSPGSVVPVNPPFTSRTSISITSPTQGTTTASTTFDIDANYTIGNDLSSFSIDGSLPTEIGINFTLLDVATNQQINLGTDYSISQSVGNHSYATTTTQNQSDYTLIATLVGDYGFTPPPPGCTPFPPFTTCEGSGNFSTLATAAPPPTFSVNNGLFPILGFQVGSTTSRSGLATTTCSITAIGGCFQNALAFLFFPSPDILNRFSNLWSLIENKPPFGYVSQTIIGLRGLNASSTSAFSFGNIPLVDTIFGPFRTGLGALLWVGFFIAFYRGRLRHLDI